MNAEDVWQKCEVNSDFSGTPILMHYDSATGVTSFIGAVDITWSRNQGTWNKTLLTLPKGYAFNQTDVSFPLGNKTSNATADIMYGTGSYYGNLKFSMSGSTVGANFNWNLDTSSLYPVGRIILLMSSLNANNTGYHCWTTMTVVPE